MRKIAVAVALALVGCATSPITPVQGQPDTYVVMNQNFFGLATQGGQQERALAAANEFCGREGKTAVLKGSSSSGVTAITAVATTVVFSCEKH